MNKYIIGILVIAALAGCSQNFKEAEKKIVEPCCKQDSQTVPLNKENIPAESIFQLTDSFQTQEGKAFSLSMLNGKTTVIGMIFTHCTYACPRLTADIKSIADSLKGEAGKLNYVLVSFDTERDIPARLKIFADEMGLNKNWILLHGSEETVRTLSVLLNVQYEKDAEGNFSHSNLVSVLDKNGVLQYQKEGLGAAHTETIKTIQKLIQQK